MSKERELRQQFGEISKKMQDLSDTLETEERGMTDDEKKDWDGWVDARNALEDRITAMVAAKETLPQTEPRHRQPVVDTPAGPMGSAGEDREAAMRDLAMRVWAVNGTDLQGRAVPRLTIRGLVDQSRSGMGSVWEEAAREHPGVAQFMAEVRNVPVPTTTGQVAGVDTLGGFAAGAPEAMMFVDAMKRYNSVDMAGAEVLNTSNIVDIPILTSDNTGRIGRWLAERQAAREEDIEVDLDVLRAYAITSDEIPVSLDLLLYSDFDFVGYIMNLLGKIIGRGIGKGYTDGIGAGQSRGVIHDAHKTITLDSKTAVTYDEFVDLQVSLDAVHDVMGPKWMFTRKTRGTTMKVKNDDGTPIFMPSLVPEAPSTVLGDMYVENDFMDTVGVGATNNGDKPVIMYGDWSAYKGRTVGAVDMYTLTEKYRSRRMLVFGADTHADGMLVDPGDHPIVAAYTPA